MITPTPPKPATKYRKADESKLQTECFQWAWENRPITRRLLFTVVNENDRADSNSISGVRRKNRGVVAGVSDMLMLIPNKHYHGLCIEFKTPIGHQSDVQVVWQQLIEKQGYLYVVCRSLEQFKEIIDNYLAD